MKTYKEIYTLIIESLVLEAMSLEDIYKKYYSKEVKNFVDFQLLNSLDPTAKKLQKGKYLDWIIRSAFKNNDNLIEDSEVVKNNLEIFDKNQKVIGKQISQIKDQYELAKIVKEFKNKKETGTLNLSDYTNQKEIEVVYNDSNWLIVVPKTVEASVFLGKNTEWCTAKYAVDDNRNRFNFYNDQGPLYILINKDKPSEKYQFHFESSQYMDSEDIPIQEESYNFISEPLLNKLIDLAKQNNSLISFIAENFPKELKTKYLTKYDKEYKQFMLNNNLIIEFYTSPHILNIKKIKELFNNGAVIENKKDFSSIMFRILNIENNIEALKLLLNLPNIDLNIEDRDDRTPLEIAIDYDVNIDIIKLMIDKGADIKHNNYQCLKNAGERQNKEVITLLLSKGAPINLDYGWLLSRIVSITDTYDEDLNLEYIEFLLKNGANPNERDFNIILSVINKRLIKVLQLLIDYGAKANRPSFLEFVSTMTDTPIDMQNILKILVKNGANPEVIKDKIYPNDYNELKEIFEK